MARHLLLLQVITILSTVFLLYVCMAYGVHVISVSAPIVLSTVAIAVYSIRFPLVLLFFTARAIKLTLLKRGVTGTPIVKVFMYTHGIYNTLGEYCSTWGVIEHHKCHFTPQ